MSSPRKPAFDAIRALPGVPPAIWSDPGNVLALDNLLDAFGAQRETPTPAAPRKVGARGIALIHSFESCARRRADGRFDAYPDPGSDDGLPWTIGWGSTGPDVKKGTVWTQAQCDARFEQDMISYAAEVSRAIGDAPTTQNQFDALVSFHYNTGAIGTATLTRLHKQGRYAEAKAEFAKWIYNNGKPMDGLKRRRAAEAALYGDRA